MANSNINIETIVRELAKKTSEDKIDWKQGATESSYIYSTENASVEIVNTTLEIKLYIKNEAGKSIANITESLPILLRSSQKSSSPGPLEELFNLARRKVNRVDETIDVLFTHISNL